jgi:putative ABC transport system permease protein
VLRLVGFESALLGFCGGVLGIIVGWLGTLVVNAQFPTRIHLYASPKLLVASLLFSVVLGILAGLYPASRAARMTPMEAIRRG